MNPPFLIKTAEYCALISFLIGTAILVHYYFTDSPQTVTVAYYYICIAAIINFVILGLILTKGRKGNPYRGKLLDAAKVILLNIPVLFLYFGIVIVLLGYVRITLNNTTTHPIEKVMITGCQEKEIATIAPGASETIWIGIPGDCSIELTYIHDGEIKKEVVVEYLTGMDGKRMVYNIGEGNK